MMKELVYPFDADEIQKKKKRYKRVLEQDESLTTKKIAILGGYTTGNIKQLLEIFLLNQGIRPEFYESEYNQYYQDAVFPNDNLKEFAPDVIYFCTSNRNVQCYPKISDDAESITAMLENEYGRFSYMWDKAEFYHCPIIQNNMEMPFYRLMGNKDAYDIHGRGNFLTRLNYMFYDYAQTHDNFYICDINYISADYGLKEWSDPYYWYMYKYAVNINAIPYLSFNVANIIKSIFGKNKKGMVLDLDNTLWGGSIGDIGAENIMIGNDGAEGQAYAEFQHYIKEHEQLGILLNIDSKNDEANAVSGLEHPDSELKADDFIEIKANWERKDKNFREIAENLNILPESLVFIDDNPAERYIVTEAIRGVSAPELGEPYRYIQNLDRNGFFEVTELSSDDCCRNKMYKENRNRHEFESAFSDYREYLANLKMESEIGAIPDLYIARSAQLANKTNQFNLTAKRYTKEEIASIAHDKDYIALYGRLSDRFGDNGIVSVVIGHIVKSICHIDLWVMSCRVLKRDMENAMMDELVRACRGRRVSEIIGYYCPTAKNHMVKGFYEAVGFESAGVNGVGMAMWKLGGLDKYEDRNVVIEVKRTNFST